MERKTRAFTQALILSFVAFAAPALAVEGGTSFYLLGSKTTMSGYVPPPGVYGLLQNYAYTGKADISFREAGVSLSGGVDADAYIALPTALWVPDWDVLGGNLAFTLTTPLGAKWVSVGVLTNPFGIELNAKRDNFAFGDPVLGTTLGWHDGNLHYSFGTLINVPIGQWKLGSPVNIGFNRWAVDGAGAITYLDTKTGLEISSTAGITYNFKNQDTDYKSGTEFHLEAAAMMHLSRTSSIGVNAYAYKQLTGDSGSDAILGDFKGRVFAIGPAADYTFTIGSTPVATNFRYFYEFGEENRLHGHAFFLNVAIPLGGPSPGQPKH